MRSARLFLSFFVAVLCASASAQVETGTPRFGTFSNGPDIINIGNLNMHLSVPVLNKQGRAGLNFNYSLNYDSSIWYPVKSGGSGYWVPVSGWGWDGLYQTAYVTYTMTTSSGTCGQYGQLQWQSWSFTNLRYVDERGIVHTFPGFQGSYVDSPGTSSYCPAAGANPSPNIPVASNDGSGLTLYPTISAGSLTAYVTGKYGQSTSPESYANSAPTSNAGTYTAIDSNGNEITANGGVYTDTTGKTALTVQNVSAAETTMTFTNTSGGQSTYVVTLAPFNIHTYFNCSQVTEYTASGQYLVTDIAAPDGSSYHFTYEQSSDPNYPSYYSGRVASIKLPTGNVISYSYTGSNAGIDCNDGSTLHLTRSLNGDSGSAASQWTYDRSYPNGAGTSQTQVVDGLGNHIEYDFVQPSNPNPPPTAQYYETKRVVNQGTGTTVLSRSTCYNAAAPSCLTASFSLPITQVDTYDTHDGIEMNGATNKYDANGNLTDVYVYDFGGSSSRGSLLEHEKWTYNYSLGGLPTEDDLYDGAGNPVGKATYGYDQTTPTTSSGVPQHTSPPSVRGNLTTLTQYASSGTSYSRTFTYEDTGSLLSATDTPTGATTNLHYDSAFVYAQEEDLPTPSSGVALSQKASYDTSYTGLLQSSTDTNSQPSYISSYDSMLRPLQATFPDGGKWTWSYSPTSVTQNIYQTASTFSTVESELDGYGRASRAFVSNGQSTNPWYQEDICYDANGNQSFVSYGYQGSGTSSSKACSGSGDSYTYDVLGRVMKVTHADGTSVNYSYYGRAMQSSDENGVTRISQADGLGRQSIVCEISSNSSMPGSGSPSSCGTDISGTGFTTNYAYNLATGTTTITQGVQTRTFQADWLGRTTSVAEPERGTTTYSYTYNSTGLQVIRTRPTANQPSPSTTTTTTTQYDVLGRPISISYSDGTVTKQYTYDAGIAGWTQSNLKGRLSAAALANGTAGTVYSYDAMGRVTFLGQCDPSVCGTTDYPTSYGYDYAGNMVMSTDGAGNTYHYSYTPANELASITSSLSDANHPQTLLSSVQYGPYGPLNWHMGNGLSGVISYDPLGRNTAGWICNGSTASYCNGGTQSYGYTLARSGSRVTTECDTALSQCMNFGYDEFDRLASRTVTYGTAQNFNYVYDRWGNRWDQSLTGGSGPSPQLSVDTSTNRISTSGYSYDAAGNLTSDGSHSYTYDAEGNLTKVDNGSETFTYDALNHRVRVDSPSGGIEFVFNPSGQHTASFNVATHAVSEDWTFWGGRQFAIYTNGTTLFDHQDWLGTERARTDAQGNTTGSYQSLPFGDGYTINGSDGDAYHFAGMDQDTTSNEHAQFRGYSNMAGRWMSPDPYDGSYDPSNPQSFNRYAYVLNSPLSFIDPLGLDPIYNRCNDEGSCGYLCDDYDLGIACYWGGTGAGAGASGPGGSPGDYLAQIDCSKPPPSVPVTPPGKSIDKNMETAVLVDAAIGNGAWAAMEAPYSVWDYKFQSGSQYTAFGNFNYGATCNAIGLSLTECQRGAGAAAYASATFNVALGGSWTAGPGNPIGSPAIVNGVPTYGDQTNGNENPMVIAGFKYAQWKRVCHK